MTLSIVIVNYRGWNFLQECLNALYCLNKAKFGWEVVIVDNHSDDGKLQEFSARFPSFRFIENSGNFGFANGNNLGAKHTTGQYLLFLNPDTIVTLEAISAMIDFAEKNPDYQVISTQQVDEKGKWENPFGRFPSGLTITGPTRALFRLFYNQRELVTYCKSHSVLFPDWISGSVFMITRESFVLLGGWDEDFWLYYEDMDLCKRVQDRGHKVALLCNVSIVHQHGGLTRQNKRNISYYKTEVLKSRHVYVNKHFRGAGGFFTQGFLVLHTLFFEQLILAVLGLIFFFFREARVHFFIYFRLWAYYLRAVKKRSWNSGSHYITLSN